MKVAWLSPFPPQRTGIADYSYALIKKLKPHIDIDVYYENAMPDDKVREGFATYPIQLFTKRRQRYDEIIYHLGNNCEFHRSIYKLAWDFPGLVVLHDYNIHSFMQDAFWSTPEEYLYKQAFVEECGKDWTEGAQELRNNRCTDVLRYSMSHAIVRRSKKVIVHHKWVKRQFTDDRHVQVIPLFANINYQPTPEDVAAFKKRHHIDGNQFVISCLGFINRNKLPQLLIEVVKRLVDEGYPIKTVFAGEVAPDMKYLVPEIQSSRHAETFIFTGYQNERNYFSGIFASDIIINLRYPSLGEASATLMHSLAAGKPAIISDVNQYKEFPDRVCWKVAHDGNEREVLYEYLRHLLGDGNLRAALSHNSLSYVKNVLSLERVVGQWLDAILL